MTPLAPSDITKSRFVVIGDHADRVGAGGGA